MRKMSHHLCLFNLLVITQCVHVIEMTPVCGRTGASSSSPSSSSSATAASLETKNTDKIYFFDQQQSIHTEQINGIIITCYADGTIINATSAATAASRTENGKREVKLQMFDKTCKLNFYEYFRCSKSAIKSNPISIVCAKCN